MKKIIIILVLAFAIQAAPQAQVLNNDFEYLNSDGSLGYWGNVYLFAAIIDSSGSSFSDSIVFDNYFYAPTTDANSGNTALELRNAWNYTQNVGIAGAVGSDEDSIFSAWGLSNLVPTNANSSYPFNPINFGFYYKFFPVNGDSAFAEIALWDSSGNQLAEGKIILSGITSDYTFIDAPLTYFSTGVAAYYSYSIYNFYTETPYFRQPSLGTRLLVDDLEFNFAPTPIHKTATATAQFDLFPNPASTHINIHSTEGQVYPYSICNVLGEIVHEGVLEPYIYAVPLESFGLGLHTIIIKTGGSTTEQHSFIISR